LLARGGFTQITLVDTDFVDETNLQRQIFIEKDIGSLKSETLKKRVSKINSKLKYSSIPTLITKNNIGEICCNSDLIVDATDNFDTRRLINIFCEKEEKCWLYVGAVKSEVVCCLFNGKDKKFNKIFPKRVKEESCCSVGVLGSTTFCAASLAYNQILKFFLKEENGEFIKFDLWTNKLHVVKV